MELVYNTPAHRFLRGGDTRIAMFRSGVICFFQAEPGLESWVLDVVRSEFMGIPESRVEELELLSGNRDGITREGVILREMDDEHIFLVALRLAQSLALELHEEAVENLLETTLGLLSDVTRTGRLPGRRGGYLRFLASASATRTEILSRLAVLDNPDIVWETPGLELLSREVSADLELTSRFRALDEKLDAIREGLEVIVVARRHVRETFLEWVIIALIAVELAFMVAGYLR